MGWLFACFGCSKKRKRLKSYNRIHLQHTRIGSYQPLESPSSHSPEALEAGYLKPVRSNLKRRKQGKASIRKKVRFNLNVIAYEPVRAYEEDDDDNGDLRSILAAEWEELEDQEAEEERPCTIGYRYSNCYDEDELDDEEEEDELDEEEEEHESLESDISWSRGVNPVLVPIENLSQWRAIKMKTREIVV